MNPVEKIREQHRTALLQGLAAKPHRKRIMHLDDIRSIGIIVHNINDEEQITLTQFSHHMTTNRGTMVRKLEINGNPEEPTTNSSPAIITTSLSPPPPPTTSSDSLSP